MVQNNAGRIGLPNVINLNDLKWYLKNFNNGTNFSIEEMDEIYHKLLNSASKMTNKDHVQNRRKTKEELEKGICPRCGGQLVELEEKYGKFWGCSNYPKCKFILYKK